VEVDDTLFPKLKIKVESLDNIIGELIGENICKKHNISKLNNVDENKLKLKLSFYGSRLQFFIEFYK
jgi:hypothetical protein